MYENFIIIVIIVGYTYLCTLNSGCKYTFFNLICVIIYLSVEYYFLFFCFFFLVQQNAFKHLDLHTNVYLYGKKINYCQSGFAYIRVCIMYGVITNLYNVTFW